jgi:hypothetical protein
MSKVAPATRLELFQGWRIQALLAKCNTLAAELEQVQAQSKPTSIWQMKKSDLQEVARKEIGLRPDQSEKMTVLEIREVIRRHRESVKAMADPLAKLPVGLSRMTSEQLVAECSQRNIPLASKTTRVQMMMMIKEHVAQAQATEDWQMAGSA